MTKIMIVDDEPDIRETIKTIMENEGYETDEATNGQELITKLNESAPQVILLDIMMPGLRTKEILTEINKNENLHNVKIIFVSVVSFTQEEISDLKKLGNIVDYIVKPFDVTVLVAAVKKHCP